MTVRRRILVLTPFPPDADGDHGGSRAIGQLLGRLAERHELTIVSLRGPADREADSHLRSNARIVDIPTFPRTSLLERARHRACLRIGVVRGVPLRVTETASAAFGDAVRRVCSEWSPDIVQIEFDVMGQFVAALDGCDAPCVLVVHEPGPAGAREGREPGGGLVRRLDVAAWSRFERSLLGRVQAAVVFTDSDRRSLEPLAGTTPVLTIPPGVVLNDSGAPEAEHPGRLVFVGNFIHAPNVDAAVRLARDIFPRIRERREDVTLELVGGNPPPAVQALAGSGVTVTGTVPDVAPYLARAAVVVVPLRQGGGMRIKVLDALAAGKATVASGVAVEGLQLGPAVRVADSDEEFALAVTDLLNDPVERSALGRRARAWAEANLQWDAAVRAYEGLYERLLEPRGSTAAVTERRCDGDPRR